MVRDLSASGFSTAMEPIAIIAMSCRLPGASGPAELWRLLCDGRSAVGEPPAERVELYSTFNPDPAIVRTAGTRPGGFVSDVDKFDAEFFGISPVEAATMDPQQRLALELGWELFEDAGIPPGALAGSPVGVFVGAMWDDYASALYRRGVAAATSHSVPGAHRSMIANRLSYALGL